jgi:phosphorylase kinase alpha/beta subunit
MLKRKKSLLVLSAFSLCFPLIAQTSVYSMGIERIPLEFQNTELKEIVGIQKPFAPCVTEAMLDKVTRELAMHGTLALRRYSSGGHSAVTVHEPRSLESAIDGMLIMHWDRDNMMQVLAEYQLAQSDPLRIELKVAKSAWFLGLLASLKHHYNYYKRFTDIIDGKAGAHDFSKRPHIRYNPINLQEVQDPWGHAQNDALGYLLFTTFYAANQGKLNVVERAVAESTDGKQPKRQFSQEASHRLGVLIPLLFEKIEVWKDFDFGAWEDKKAEHASSIGCALAGLRQEKRFVDKYGSLTEKIDGKDYTVTSELLAKLIAQCEESLSRILPNEFVNSDPEDKRADASRDRKADSALINALFLGAVAEEPLLSEKMTAEILDVTANQLCRPIGFARYPLDIWDGRTDRRDLKQNEEAQWSHVAPMMSVIYGDLYLRTKNQSYFELQDFFFRRSLTTVNKRWRIPEAYIVDPKTRQWVSDANEPLAWAQSVEIMAILAMKRSLAERNAVKPAGQGSKPVEPAHKPVEPSDKIKAPK